jgi:hypothetical protein
MEFVLAATGQRRLLVPIPFALAELQASVLQFLPTPPLTPGEVELLKHDNVVSAAAKREVERLKHSESSPLQSRRSSRLISDAFAVEGNVNVGCWPLFISVAPFEFESGPF